MLSSLLSLFPRRGSGWPPATRLAFVGLVLVAYLGSIWEGSLSWSRSRDWVCVGLGAAFCVMGMMDLEILIHHRPVWARRLYVALLTVLLFAILWTSRLNGEVSFCVYPVVAVCLALLNPVPATWAVVGLYAMTLTVETRFGGLPGLERWAYSLIPGFVFVIVFTQLAIRANAARERSEALAAEIERLTVIQERNRLAREIHDSLGHFLTTIHVQLQAAQAVHPTDPSRALEAVAKAQALARDALVEVRRSVSSLQADVVLPPLPARLRDLAVATDGWGAAVSLQVLGTVRTLSPAAEHALFRAAQEGLTNVRKHAQAQTAVIELDYRSCERVHLRITDDGCGMGENTGGHGLNGLHERITALGGKVLAENRPSGGFQLQLEIAE